MITSGSASSGDGLRNLGDLAAGADDLLTLSIFGILNVFVLALSTLPDLDFAAAANDTDAHGAEQIVGGVAMHVDTTVEHGGGIFADAGADHGLSSWMVLDEGCHIVYNASNVNEGTTILCLILEVFVFHDRESIQWNAPIEPGALHVELLLLLLDTTFLDLVGTELLQVIRKTKLLPDPDRPLGGVVLPPVQGVAVVGWEFVVEIVVALTKCHQCGEDMVTRRVAVIKRLVTEPMSKGVDTEGGLLNEEDAEDASVDEATEEVVEGKATKDGGKDQAHEDDDFEVMTVLPDDYGIFVQV